MTTRPPSLQRPGTAPGARSSRAPRGATVSGIFETLGASKCPAAPRCWRTGGALPVRAAHPAVGAGAHERLQAEPYVFARTLGHEGASDAVVVGLGLPAGRKTVPVGDVFAEGEAVIEAYTGANAVVREGAVVLDTPSGIVLLARDEAGGD